MNTILNPRTRMKRTVLFVLISLLALHVSSQSGDVEILSLGRNGLLSWTNSSLNVTCRVEWAATVDGPWHGSWESLANIVVTNSVTSCEVPMFYRVVAMVPLPPLLTNITAAASLELLAAHTGDPTFAVIDVRTAAEYASRHIKTAVNIDYYSATFASAINALDKSKTYLIYCGSGTRSTKAMDVIRPLGFARVYNMTGGLNVFNSLTGAAAYLEP
jgi:rhodanese-related sulfurtransferase